MRVLHLTAAAAGDGAAVAVGRLHRALLRSGADSTLMALHVPPGAAAPTVRPFVPSRSLAARVRRRLRAAVIGRTFARGGRTMDWSLGGLTDDRAALGDEVAASLPPCDVVTVHAMAGFLDYRDFLPAAARRAPVVRVLHDMNFFTGGCHYDEGCGRFNARCGACPQLRSDRERDLSRAILTRKRAALAAVPAGRLCVVAPGHRLAAAARRSALLRDVPVTVIPHGLDVRAFAPGDRAAARALLGVPTDRFVVLFVAAPLGRRVKGFADLARALALARRRSDLFLLTAGGGEPPAPVDVPHRHHGWIDDERQLPALYAAADICVAPSLWEAFGQTVVEAMACGTPVVAYDAGGIGEIVRHGETGLLAPPGDVGALAEAIDAVAGSPAALARMQAQARAAAVRDYDVALQARRYLALYEALVSGAAPPASFAGLTAGAEAPVAAGGTA